MGFKNVGNDGTFANFTGTLSANTDTLFYNSTAGAVTLEFTTTTGNGSHNWVKTLEPGEGVNHRAPVTLAGVVVTITPHHTGIRSRLPIQVSDNEGTPISIGSSGNEAPARVIAAVLGGGLS